MRTRCVLVQTINVPAALRLGLLIYALLYASQSSGQIIEVIGAHEQGKIVDGRKSGVWTYLDENDDVAFKIDFDNAEVVYFKPDSGEFLVSRNGSPWAYSKLSRPVIYPGKLGPLSKLLLEKTRSDWTKPPIAGVSWLQFVVNRSGVATSPKVINATSVEQEKALLDFFAEMPKQWIAGMVGHEFVDCLMAVQVEVVQTRPSNSVKPSREHGKVILWNQRIMNPSASPAMVDRRPGLFYGNEMFFWARNDSVLTFKTDNNDWHTGFQFDRNGKLIRRFASTEPFLISCETTDCLNLLVSFDTDYGEFRNAKYNTVTSAFTLGKEREDFLIIPSPDKKKHLFRSTRSGKPFSYVKNVETGKVTQIPLSDGLTYGSWVNSDSILFGERAEGFDNQRWIGRVFLYSMSARSFKDASWLFSHELVDLSPDGKGALIKKREHYIAAPVGLKYFDFATGKSKRLLPSHIESGIVFWSKDPDYFYYHIGTELYRKRISTKEKELILTNVMMPRINHSKTMIAFINATDGNFYTCDLNGKSVKLLIIAPH